MFLESADLVKHDLMFVFLLQPTSPEVPRSAMALSETGAVVAWPSLGDAKGPQRKKQSLSAPVTPSKKVHYGLNNTPFFFRSCDKV